MSAAPMPKTNRIPIMMSDAEVQAIDDWRFANRVPTRSEAVRQLTELGLAFKEQEHVANIGLMAIVVMLNGNGADIHLLETYIKFLKKMDNSTKAFAFPELLRPLSKNLDTAEVIRHLEASVARLKQEGTERVIAAPKPSSEGQE